MFKAEEIDDFVRLSGVAIGEAWPLLLLAQPRQPVAWASAPESRCDYRGASPLWMDVHHPVAEGNCIVKRRCGEQPEASLQSVG